MQDGRRAAEDARIRLYQAREGPWHWVQAASISRNSSVERLQEKGPHFEVLTVQSTAPCTTSMLAVQDEREATELAKEEAAEALKAQSKSAQLATMKQQLEYKAEAAKRAAEEEAAEAVKVSAAAEAAKLAAAEEARGINFGWIFALCAPIIVLRLS